MFLPTDFPEDLPLTGNTRPASGGLQGRNVPPTRATRNLGKTLRCLGDHFLICTTTWWFVGKSNGPSAGPTLVHFDVRMTTTFFSRLEGRTLTLKTCSVENILIPF